MTCPGCFTFQRITASALQASKINIFRAACRIRLAVLSLSRFVSHHSSAFPMWPSRSSTLLECVNPGNQSFEVPRVDLVLKPCDLIPQIAQVLKDVVRTCVGQNNRAVDRS